MSIKDVNFFISLYNAEAEYEKQEMKRLEHQSKSSKFKRFR